MLVNFADAAARFGDSAVRWWRINEMPSRPYDADEARRTGHRLGLWQLCHLHLPRKRRLHALAEYHSFNTCDAPLCLSGYRFRERAARPRL